MTPRGNTSQAVSNHLSQIYNKMTPRGNTSQAVSNHPSQIYNNKDDAEGKHVSSCQQSSVTDLQQQITALVDTVAQLSVNMAIMNKKVDERVPTDQHIGGSPGRSLHQ